MTETTTRTTVIDATARDPEAIRADPDAVWVGRFDPDRGFECSMWANPFVAGQTWAEACEVARCQAIPAPYEVLTARDAASWYGRWIWTQSVLVESLPRLQGKTLVCTCCDFDGEGEPTAPCHGVYLCRLANETAADAETLARAMALPVASRYDLTREVQS